MQVQSFVSFEFLRALYRVYKNEIQFLCSVTLIVPINEKIWYSNQIFHEPIGQI